jgi:hypothetical protein
VSDGMTYSAYVPIGVDACVCGESCSDLRQSDGQGDCPLAVRRRVGRLGWLGHTSTPALPLGDDSEFRWCRFGVSMRRACRGCLGRAGGDGGGARRESGGACLLTLPPDGERCRSSFASLRGKGELVVAGKACVRCSPMRLEGPWAMRDAVIAEF